MQALSLTCTLVHSMVTRTSARTHTHTHTHTHTNTQTHKHTKRARRAHAPAAAGLSTAWVGFCVNFFVTVVAGLILQYGPLLMPKLTQLLAQDTHARSIDIGPVRDPLIHPKYMVPFFLLLLFCVPFYRKHDAPDDYVGSLASWAFTSLFLSGILALASAAVYLYAWRDYQPLPMPGLPAHDADADLKEGKVHIEHTNPVADSASGGNGGAAGKLSEEEEGALSHKLGFEESTKL